MKPLLFLAALAAALQLSSSSALASGDWTWPVRGEVITQYRNAGDPYAAGQHRGIDIAAAVGEPVVAATGGDVTFSGVAGSSGLTVAIRTADGRFDTSYLHLSSAAVRAGQALSAGQRIGAVGTTGKRSAEQPHLHFGVREAGKRQAYLDPLDFLAAPPAPPRPEPAPPRGTPVPVGDRAPIPLPVAVAAPAAAPGPALSPRPLAPALPAARHAARRAHALHAPQPAEARPSPAIAARPVAHPGRVGHPLGEPRPAHPAHGARPSAPARSPHVRLDAAPREASASSPGVSRRPAVRAPSGGGGFNAGWLAACIGMVAAACALGRPDGAKAAAARGRDAFASLLRPLNRPSGGRG